MSDRRQLTFDEECDLADRIQCGLSPDASAEAVADGRETESVLCERNLPLAYATAIRMTRPCPWLTEDASGAAIFGLLKAARKYRSDKARESGTRFGTHATYWIGYEVRRYLYRYSGPITISPMAYDHPTEETKRLVSAATTIERLGLYNRAVSEYDDSIASLDNDLPEVASLLEMLPDSRSRYILIRHYGLDGQPAESLRVVAERIGLSRTRIFQLERIAIELIREIVIRGSNAK